HHHGRVLHRLIHHRHVHHRGVARHHHVVVQLHHLIGHRHHGVGTAHRHVLRGDRDRDDQEHCAEECGECGLEHGLPPKNGSGGSLGPSAYALITNVNIRLIDVDHGNVDALGEAAVG